MFNVTVRFRGREMEGTGMTTREKRRTEMYPGIATMQPIMVGRHQDYMEEARQRRLLDQARAGTPRRPRFTATRQLLGLAVISLGQRLAGSSGEVVERLPGKPVPQGVR